MLLYSSRVPVWTSLYVPLFTLFLSTFFEGLCSLLRNPGGTGRTEPLFYIAGCTSILLIILTVVRAQSIIFTVGYYHFSIETIAHCYILPHLILKRRLFYSAQSFYYSPSRCLYIPSCSRKAGFLPTQLPPPPSNSLSHNIFAKIH